MTRLHSIRKRIGRLAQLPARRRRLVLEAAFELLIARISLALLPFPALARRLGTFTAAGHHETTDPGSASGGIASEIRWAIDRVARHLPLSLVCLPRALAARKMLVRRGMASVLHLGARRGTLPEKRLDTHAWLDAAGIEVTGYPTAREFVEVACFVTAPAPRPGLTEPAIEPFSRSGRIAIQR